MSLSDPDRPVIQQRLHPVRGVKQQHSMLIPSVHMLKQAIRAVPEGAKADLARIRRELAARHEADACCPVTTQRHLRGIAEETWGAVQQGKARSAITPFWRVVDAERPNARRLAGGVEFIRARQAEEAR